MLNAFKFIYRTVITGHERLTVHRPATQLGNLKANQVLMCHGTCGNDPLEHQGSIKYTV